MKFKLTIFIGMIASMVAMAQEEQEEEYSFIKNTKVTGSLDVFYKYDFADTNANTLTSFTNTGNNSFELGMASLKFVNKYKKATATVDVGFGNRAEQFSYNDESTKLIIKQLFLDYAVNDKLTLTAGSWATHFGYEFIDPVDNDLYSMSYTFSYGPFFHTGAKANYVAKEFNFMAGLANPTDLKSANGFDNKYFIWQVGYTGEKLSAYLNGQSGSNNPGDSNVNQFGLTAVYKATDKLKLGFDGTIVMFDFDSGADKQNWSSLVGYANYSLKEKIALNLRSEYLSDKDGFITGSMDNSVFANTLGLTFTEGNLKFKPELRFESASEKIFIDSDQEATKSAFQFLVGIAYKL